MATDPQNERYQHEFEDGEYGWGEGTDEKDGYQDIIDDLEIDVTVKEPEATIENFRPVAGRTFEATDAEREYIGDGTAWVQRATRGPNPTFESATVEGPTHTDELLGIKSRSFEFPQGGQLTTKPLYYAEDTDTATSLSFDTGSFGAEYDEFHVKAHVEGHDSDLAFKPVSITFNGLTTADYQYNYLENTGTGHVSGATAWHDEIFSNWMGMLQYRIKGKPGDGFEPFIVGESGSHTSSRTLQNGLYFLNSNLIDSLQVSTGFPTTGKIAVFGVTF